MIKINAFIPGGRVVLKFQKDRYDVATHLMKMPAPTAQKIKDLKKSIVLSFEKNESPDLPYEFLKAMMELSYSGNFNLALNLVDETWPSEKQGLEKFKDEFSKALHESPYWKKL
jgi:tRNA A37 threonylcarbamoyltransferase TsaD